jgi:hypothetical protein
MRDQHCHCSITVRGKGASAVAHEIHLLISINANSLSYKEKTFLHEITASDIKKCARTGIL